LQRRQALRQFRHDARALSAVKLTQPAISATVRPQPAQSAETGSTAHTLLQGVSMSAMSRCGEVRRATVRIAARKAIAEIGCSLEVYVPIPSSRRSVLALAAGGGVVAASGCGC
jgi:hypothetical protein